MKINILFLAIFFSCSLGLRAAETPPPTQPAPTQKSPEATKAENEKAFLNVAKYFDSVDKIKDLLGKGVDINVQNAEGKTALHIAAENGIEDTVSFLVKQNGIKLDLPDNAGQRPLHLAVKRLNLTIVKTLLDAGAQVNAVDSHKQTALHLACESTSYEAADIEQLLIQKGATLDAKDDNGQTPLHLACKTNLNIRCVKLLTEKNAKIDITDTNEQTPLHLAAKVGNTEAVEELLKPKIIGGGFFSRGKIQEFDFKKYIDLKDKKNQTALHLAASGEHTKIVKMLKDKDAATDIKDNFGQTAFFIVAKEGLKDALKVVVGREPNISDFDIKNNDGETPLLAAAKSGNVKGIEYLTNVGLNVNEKDEKGNTALHLAVQANAPEAVKILLEKGSDLTAKNKEGQTAADIAIEKKETKIVGMLATKAPEILKAEATPKLVTPKETSLPSGKKDAEPTKPFLDANFTDENGQTMLHHAAKSGDIDLINQLIGMGAKIDAQDKNGDTPLHLAVKNNKPEVVDILIQRKANLNIQNNEKETPLHLAVVLFHKDIIDKLISQPQIQPSLLLQNARGDTPLHYALERKISDVDQIKKFLPTQDPSKVLQIQNTRGSTPLHLATENGLAGVVTLFLTYSPDPSIQDKQGNTPLTFAILSGNPDLIKQLLALPSASKSFDAIYDAITKGIIQAKSEKNNKQLSTLINLCTNNKIVNSKQQTILMALATKPYSGSPSPADETFKHIIQGTKIDDINADNVLTHQDSDGKTLIYLLTENRRKDLIKIPLEKMKSLEKEPKYKEKEYNEFKSKVLNSPDKDDIRPLYLAVKNEDIDIIPLLIEYGANILAKTPEQITIFVATATLAEKKSDKVKQTFFTTCMQFNVRSGRGRSILHLAAMNTDVRVVQSVLDYKNDYKYPNQSFWGKTQAQAFNIFTDVDEYGNTPLHLAAKTNNTLVAKQLLNNDQLGASLRSQNKDGKTPIFLALENNNKDLVQYLAGYMGSITDNVDKDGQTLLHIATKSGNLKTVNMVLDLANHELNFIKAQDNLGRTALHIAAELGYSEIIKSLVPNEGMISRIIGYYNEYKESGREGFSWFSFLRKIASSELTANVSKVAFICDVCDNNGQSPLFYALKINKVPMDKKLDVINLLISYGAKTNIVDHDGKNVLNYAIENDFISFAELFLDRKPNKELLDASATGNKYAKRGKTALHWAAEAGCSPKAASLLLQSGADIDARTAGYNEQIILQDFATTEEKVIPSQDAIQIVQGKIKENENSPEKQAPYNKLLSCLTFYKLAKDWQDHEQKLPKRTAYFEEEKTTTQWPIKTTDEWDALKKQLKGRLLAAKPLELTFLAEANIDIKSLNKLISFADMLEKGVREKEQEIRTKLDSIYNSVWWEGISKKGKNLPLIRRFFKEAHVPEEEQQALLKKVQEEQKRLSQKAQKPVTEEPDVELEFVKTRQQITKQKPALAAKK